MVRWVGRGGQAASKTTEARTESIVLCTSGAASIAGAHGSITLVRGQAAYISADEGALTLAGTATLFLAAPSRSAS